MYLRAVRTYKSVVIYSCISENLQVSSYVLMYLRAVRTYKSVVIYSCISEQSELTSQQLCAHVSQSSRTFELASDTWRHLPVWPPGVASRMCDVTASVLCHHQSSGICFNYVLSDKNDRPLILSDKNRENVDTTCHQPVIYDVVTVNNCYL